jgi:pimeloyl-ACP methyl ester carboxylesterase
MPTRSIDANGLNFTVDVAGEGDTVALLLHGFPEARAAWRRQLEALPALGWTVAAPDLRGYGDSARPSGVEAYAINHLVDDVAGMFDALGAKRRILMGHDWGGVIAWAAALRGLPLDGLVILNAPHPVLFRKALKTWDQRRRSWYILFFQIPLLPELGLTRGGAHGLVRGLKHASPGFPPDILETYRTNLLAPGAATAMINYYRANARRIAAGAANPGPLRTPTLMIWGEEDAYLGPALMEGNEALVADFTLRRLPGVSHWVQEDAPELVNAAIAEWARAKGLAAS